MPRTAPPAVRTMLIERAAEMLARREPVSLRSLVAGTGVSTMAVYTHFEGMPGLWRAVRQEGFTRLGERLANVPTTDDPIRDLAALGAAYQAHAVANPDLYRAMFDATVDLEDPAGADEGFGLLVAAATRAVEAGRLSTDPRSLAVRYWASGHGLAMLRIGGVLDQATWWTEAEAVALALLTAAGDDPEACRRSVGRGWATA